MPFQIALPFYEFQKHFCANYSVRDFYEEFEDFAYNNYTPRLIDIEYKYGVYASGKSTIHWRCCYNAVPKTDWHTTKYGGSTDFAAWWCALTDDYEGLCEDNTWCRCGESDCDCA